MLRGDPGVGKSVLLSELAGEAGDMQVLRATGVEAESELAFAGVHQLVWPLLDTLDEIPARQAAALRGALGLDAPAGDDRFLIGAAVLSLLAVAAESSPVLSVVDDAHWLDTASADALTFAARRLNAEPVGVVFAARDDDVRRFDGAGLPELRVASLDSGPARALLDERAGVELAAEVREQIVAIASGNPLALLELSAALSADQLAGRAPLSETVPVTRTIESVFLSRLRDLPEAGMTLMLLAAADDTGETAVVLRAATELGVDSAVVDGVEKTGLVQFGERDVRFRHSLVRSAGLSGGELRRAAAGAPGADRGARRGMPARGVAACGRR